MENQEIRDIFEAYLDSEGKLSDIKELLKGLNYNPTLGSLIGKVVDNFAITNDNGDKVQLKLMFDFSTATDVDIKSWLCGNRRIALQRPARAMSADELKALNDTTIIAVDAGKKVKTKAERIKEAQATIAALKANFPSEYANLVSEMSVNEDEETLKE